MTYLLGITGGIGSGKSEVCSILKEFGARVFSADREAAEIMASNAEVRKRVIQEFGEDCYSPDGKLNSSVLAGKVFGDPERLALLNSIVHPLVYDAFKQAADKAREQDVKVLVLEAAILFESGGEKFLEGVAVVDAPEGLRVKWVAARDGSDLSEVKARMLHQFRSEELRKRANWMIENNGTIDELREQVEKLWKDIWKSGL